MAEDIEGRGVGRGRRKPLLTPGKVSRIWNRDRLGPCKLCVYVSVGESVRVLICVLCVSV